MDSKASQRLDLNAFQKILTELSYQPDWRARAQRAANYYDGKQLPTEVVAAMEERGQPVIIHNLIRPAINGVLGLEARTRTDCMVKADDEDGVEIAEGLNQKLSDAIRLSNFDRACSDAYAAQVKTGIGWVEIDRNPDPFAAPYRATYVHRREVYWDWHAQQPDLSDARWMIRRRWMQKDVAVGTFPQHEELIENVCSRWSAFDALDTVDMVTPDLVGHWGDYKQTTWDESEWLDTEREEILVNVVYYRVYSKKPILRLGNGRVIEYQENNPLHVAAVAMGKVKPEVVPFPKIRVAWFLGPHLLDDKESDAPHNHFPLVPFWGYREDDTGIPYGLVEGMIPAQDETNLRRSKLTWLLNAKRIIMDDDVTDMPHEQVRDEVDRADGQIILNAQRQNKDANAFRVEQDFNVAGQQFQVMQDSMRLIQDTAGIYSAFLGQEGAAQSGIAINSLVEQGNMTLAELNDNYRYARRQAAELMLAYIIEDSKGYEHEVVVQADGKKPRHIPLNKRSQDEYGNEAITNDVSRVRAHVVLADIQSTPGYRAQLLERMMALVGTLPDDMKMVLLPSVVDLTDVPDREEVLKLIRQRLGMVDEEDMTEEEVAQRQREQEMQAAQQELAFQEVQGKIAKLQAEVRRLNADAAGKERDIESKALDDKETQARTAKLLAEMSATVEEVKSLRGQMLMSLDQQIRALGSGPINNAGQVA